MEAYGFDSVRATNNAGCSAGDMFAVVQMFRKSRAGHQYIITITIYDLQVSIMTRVIQLYGIDVGEARKAEKQAGQ